MHCLRARVESSGCSVRWRCQHYSREEGGERGYNDFLHDRGFTAAATSNDSYAGQASIVWQFAQGVNRRVRIRLAFQMSSPSLFLWPYLQCDDKSLLLVEFEIVVGVRLDVLYELPSHMPWT